MGLIDGDKLQEFPIRAKGRYLVAECKGVRESFFPEDIEAI